MILAALIATFPFIHHAHEVIDHLPLTESSILSLTEETERQFEKDLDQFLAIPMEKRTFDNTIRYWDALNGEVSQAIYRLNSLMQIHPEKAFRNCADQAYQKLDQMVLQALASHPEIYNACIRCETEELSEEERYFLNHLLFEFRHRGMQLPEEKRARFAQIKQEISALESLFDRQVAEDAPILFVPKEELNGLEETWFHSRKQNEAGDYELACDVPTYADILTYCSLRTTRKAMYELFTNRAFPQNEKVAIQLMEKRKQLAELAGFPSYAAYDLSAQMVGSPERADAFLNELKPKITQKARAEFALVTETLPESVTLTPSGKLERFDELYVYNQYKKKHFSVDQKLISEYFPMEKTIQGLIWIYEQFFNLSIQEVPVATPIPDLKTLEIRAPSGQLLGFVLLDLFPREGKCGHSGACYSMIHPYSPPEGPDYPALCLIIGNFTKPTQDHPSLMNHREVITFFHEFGHAIHSVLGRNEFFSFCGMSVKQDFLEVPSKLLENWIWDSTILKRISSHYVSGEALPDEWIENMIQSREFGWGAFQQRNCYHSKLALAYFGEQQVQNPTQLMHQFWEQEVPLLSLGENCHFYTSWWHFSNYGPKFYSYMWSEVFACDLFEKIREGGLLNPEMGAEYSQKILSPGGGKDPEQMLIDFLGRKPSSVPFLKHLD